jgi:hypothetical protein
LLLLYFFDKRGCLFYLNAFLVEFMDLWGLWGFVIEKMLIFWGWVFLGVPKLV